MRFSQDRLIFKALCALDEVVERARKDRVEPDFAIRFALAYLHSVRIREDDWCYREFLQTISRTPSFEQPGVPMRGTLACTQFQCICRSVGIEYTVEFEVAMQDARKSKQSITAGSAAASPADSRSPRR
jgi:hypothetical protein